MNRPSFHTQRYMGAPPPLSLSPYSSLPLNVSLSEVHILAEYVFYRDTKRPKDPSQKLVRSSSGFAGQKTPGGGWGGGSSTRVSRLERRIELRSGGDPGYPPHGNTRGARSALPSARPLLACLSVRSFLTACLSVCFFLSVSVCDCLPFGDLCAGLWRQGGAVSNYCLTSKSVKMYRI